MEPIENVSCTDQKNLVEDACAMKLGASDNSNEIGILYPCDSYYRLWADLSGSKLAVLNYWIFEENFWSLFSKCLCWDVQLLHCLITKRDILYYSLNFLHAVASLPLLVSIWLSFEPFVYLLCSWLAGITHIHDIYVAIFLLTHHHMKSIVTWWVHCLEVIFWFVESLCPCFIC